MSDQSFQTSKEAYDYCVDNDILTEREAQVMKALADATGPMNQTMTYQAIVRATGIVGLESRSVGPRFAVLLRMGLIREIAKAQCPVTKRKTVFYELTLKKPVMSREEASKAPEDRKKTITTLERENRELRDENAKLRELLNVKQNAYREREEKILTRKVELQTVFFAP